jgi:hypothetical protein
LSAWLYPLLPVGEKYEEFQAGPGKLRVLRAIPGASPNQNTRPGCLRCHLHPVIKTQIPERIGQISVIQFEISIAQLPRARWFNSCSFERLLVVSILWEMTVLIMTALHIDIELAKSIAADKETKSANVTNGN